eukprot:18940-Heterococcus_DN1.PRE.1
MHDIDAITVNTCMSCPIVDTAVPHDLQLCGIRCFAYFAKAYLLLHAADVVASAFSLRWYCCFSGHVWHATCLERWICNHVSESSV